MTETQIVYLEQFQAQFDAAYALPGETRPVREYAAEYAHVPDLFDSICADLGLGRYADLRDSR